MHLSHHSTFNCLSEARSTFFSEGVIFPILKMDDLPSLLIFFGLVLFFWHLLDREKPVGVVLIAPTCVNSYDRTFKAASFTLDWVHALWPRWHFWEIARLRSPPLLLTASWMKDLLLQLICLLEAMINQKKQKIHQEKNLQTGFIRTRDPIRAQISSKKVEFKDATNLRPLLWAFFTYFL